MRPLASLALLCALIATAHAQEAATPWIGAGVESSPKGVLLTEVFEDQPAGKAGLRAGETITAIDGLAVAEADQLIELIHRAGIGTQVTFDVLGKNGTARKVSMALVARPEMIAILKQRLLGKPAPDFASAPQLVAGPAGKPGQVVYLEFWATYCPACIAGMPRLLEWQKKNAAKIRVVSVTSEKRLVVERWLRAHPLPYAVASDESGEVSLRYRASLVPTEIVIDGKGVVRFVAIGGGSEAESAMAAAEKLAAPAAVPAAAPAKKRAR